MRLQIQYKLSLKLQLKILMFTVRCIATVDIRKIIFTNQNIRIQFQSSLKNIL